MRNQPLQHLKKIRLTKTKSLNVEESLRMSVAATKVGNERPTQFGREHK